MHLTAGLPAKRCISCPVFDANIEVVGVPGEGVKEGFGRGECSNTCEKGSGSGSMIRRPGY